MHTELTSPGEVSKYDILLVASSVVEAFVGMVGVTKEDLPKLFEDVHATVSKCAAGPAPIEIKPAQAPAVDPKKSIHADYLICLEDGQRFKSLKRHLMAHFGMTPDDYRKKWDLPADYPMVAPNYAAARSQLAKQMGLGKKK